MNARKTDGSADASAMPGEAALVTPAGTAASFH
jgi:hypothetical protein